MTVVRSIAGFVVAFAAALFLLINTRFQAGDQHYDHLEQLKDKYVRVKWQLINLDAFRARQREAELTLDKLAKVLPTQFDTEFTPVLAAARHHHLRLEHSPHGDEAVREFYSTMGMRIAVTGRFHDLGAFAAELDNAPACLSLRDINLSPVSPGNVRMEAVVWAYRFLDDAEIEQRRKAAKAGKP